jgi:hypothetical protein
VGEDRHAVALLEAERHEPERGLAHGIAEFLERNVDPLVALLVLQGGPAGVLLRGQQGQVGHRLRSRAGFDSRDGCNFHVSLLGRRERF